MKKKVTVIGAGNVGATAAQRLIEKHICDVILVDINGDMAKGKALDLNQAAPVEYHDSKITGTSDYTLTKNSDVVIITAGIARKPGMSRDELVETNSKIMTDVAKKAVDQSPDAVFIIVSNPLDVMCQIAFNVTGLPKNRIIGMAGVLDSARFKTFISMELDVSVENIDAFVLGGHGDTMVPLPRFTTVAGIPVTELIEEKRLNELMDRTRTGGAEIVGYLKTGSAYYAPASSAVEMTKSILFDKKKIMPCAAYLEGEYGINGIFMGVPVKLGKNGIEQIIEISLKDEEKKALEKSATAVRTIVQDIAL